MRVLQINVVYGEKSTGRTCAEVEKYLISKGVECYTAYGVGKKPENNNSYRIENKLGYYIHNILSRITGKEGYFSFIATARLVRYIKEIKPDVIHLRNLHGHFLNLPILFKYLKKTQIPLVINTHDCWIFTGKCPHPILNNCDKWQSECHNCPAVKGYPASWVFDFSTKMFKDKKKWLTGLNVISVVGVSDWVSEEAKKSILNQYPVKRIYNWINLETFRPYENNDVFDEYGIPKDKFTVICVASAWKEGTVKNKELEELISKADKDMQFIVVGAESDKIKGKNVYPISFVDVTAKLAKLYSASDVYVHLSAADTFGKVIAEALACGTPAVVYDCTACPELVKDGCGKAVTVHDVDALLEAIIEIKQKGKETYTSKCVERVSKEFDYEKNCSVLLDLYTEGTV